MHSSFRYKTWRHERRRSVEEKRTLRNYSRGPQKTGRHRVALKELPDINNKPKPDERRFHKQIGDLNKNKSIARASSSATFFEHIPSRAKTERNFFRAFRARALFERANFRASRADFRASGARTQHYFITCLGSTIAVLNFLEIPNKTSKRRELSKKTKGKRSSL